MDDVISKYFRRVGMYPSTIDSDDANEGDSFACEELLDLEALEQKMSKKCIDVAPYATINDDTDAYHCLDPAELWPK